MSIFASKYLPNKCPPYQLKKNRPPPRPNTYAYYTNDVDLNTNCNLNNEKLCGMYFYLAIPRDGKKAFIKRTQNY